jgi:hypothetical protein
MRRVRRAIGGGGGGDRVWRIRREKSMRISIAPPARTSLDNFVATRVCPIGQRQNSDGFGFGPDSDRMPRWTIIIRFVRV